MIQASRPLRSAVIALTLVAVVAAGCTSDDDDVASGGDGDGGAQAAETIKIGVALPDIEAFARINEAFDVGDQEAQINAPFDAWRDEGILPLHDRDVELVVRRYNILNADDKVATCRAFAQDDDVFAVVAGRNFTEGSTCLAQRFQIPVIDTDGALSSQYEAGAPYLFTLRSGLNDYFVAVARWGVEMGFLDGALGLFWETRLEEAVNDMKAEMEALGVNLASEISASGEGIGTPQDKVAMQRFQADGVEVVLPLIGGSSMIAALTFAEEQGYRPQYISTDYGTHTADVATGPYPPEQFDGMHALTVFRVGEIAADMELADATTECIENYEAFTGETVEIEAPESGAWTNILLMCDLANIVRAGLENAGEDLTQESFVAGLEAIDGLELAGHGAVTYGPGEHGGVSEFRTVQWSADCTCWVAQGDFETYT